MRYPGQYEVRTLRYEPFRLEVGFPYIDFNGQGVFTFEARENKGSQFFLFRLYPGGGGVTVEETTLNGERFTIVRFEAGLDLMNLLPENLPRGSDSENWYAVKVNGTTWLEGPFIIAASAHHSAQ